MKRFNHKEIEKKWQKRWKDSGLYEVSIEEAENPYYLLVEFPYPSGDLHIGHWHAFAVPDIFARYMRMNGSDVLFPIGFDAFGLPAENAAIKHGKDPAVWTKGNIESMEKQFESMGNSIDWSKKVITCEPSYYKWTQWIFTKLFEHGLAYKKDALVNWDPKDKTVLANEQVLPDGTAERSGAVVEQRAMNQWFLKITEYADRLIDDLKDLNWPDEIKKSQKAWIGRSSGATIPFKINTGDREDVLNVFTTRPDTLFGVTYLAISPECAKDLSADWWHANDETSSFIENAIKERHKDRDYGDKEKNGFKTDLVAVNPVNGKEIPVYISSYVLSDYGFGAVMGVPAHDERDFDFAKKFNIEIVPVIEPKMLQNNKDVYENIMSGNMVYTGPGPLINSDKYDGKDSSEVFEEIVSSAGGEQTNNYRLRDWSIGRQRYWGCPIPIVYSPEGDAFAVPEEHLPWLLPTDVDFTPDGEAPLARSKELKERTEKIFGEGWTPEVDTMDTFMDSSWYYLRYLSPNNEDVFATSDNLEKWIPVNRYSGGAEHTTMHVLYARFIHKALYDLALVPSSEPFDVRMNRGLILGPDGAKMSKSKGNVINPDAIVDEFGSDAVKSYLAFIGPYNEVGNYPWNLKSVIGVRRFLDKVFVMQENLADRDLTAEEEKQINRAIAKVSNDVPAFKFHTALAALMSLSNFLEKQSDIPRSLYKKLVVILAPFAPHLTEEIWEMLGEKESVHKEPWLEAEVVEKSTANIAVQINGKTKGVIEVDIELSKEQVFESAKSIKSFAEVADEAGEYKLIFVPNKIINIVK